jgi:hypothetical protein
MGKSKNIAHETWPLRRHETWRLFPILLPRNVELSLYLKSSMSATASWVFTKMNVIQQNLDLVPRFVSIYMYYHVCGSFLGILLLIPFTQWGARRHRSPGVIVFYNEITMAQNPGTPRPGTCRRIIRHDKKDQAYTILVGIYYRLSFPGSHKNAIQKR